jgi:hypothetical protein
MRAGTLPGADARLTRIGGPENGRMGRTREPRSSAVERADKVCGSCGRRIQWRASWSRNWESVRWCSDACRARKVTAVDRELEASILRLLSERAAGATICPSEAARAVAAHEVSAPAVAAREVGAPDGADDAWRDLMEPARRAARRLVATGEVEIMQGGRPVDPSTARGPIRIRLIR